MGSNWTLLLIPNTQTQPIINQIKTNTEIRIVAIIFKQTPQLAAIVNAAESEIKHMNVLKENAVDQLNQTEILFYIARSIASPARAKPQIPDTIIYIGICGLIGQSFL